MDDLAQKLDLDFFNRDDVCLIARELLGKILVTNFDGRLCKGRIVEVEAYNGRTDKACHAYGGRRTKRTETLYGKPGTTYVYLCYGIHHLFNVVTNKDGLADAILIRALEPIEGRETMKMRLNSSNQKLTNGPGILSKAMGITTQWNGTLLDNEIIWIEKGETLDVNNIVETTRIGIDYAGEDALLPWRFFEKDNRWVSKK